MSGSARASAPTAAAELERRGSRARLLALEAPMAAEPLLFVAGLYAVQANVAESFESAHSRLPFSGRLGEDVGRFGDEIREVLDYAVRSGPAPLAEAASSRRNDSRST